MTAEKRSTFGLSLNQMADLFAMGSEDPDPGDAEVSDETLATLLSEQLACTDSDGSLLLDTLIMMMDRTNGRCDPLANRPLGKVLLDPASGIDLLRTIKDCSKTLSCTLESGTETALARTVYFAALAGALVHHDTKITQLSYGNLGQSLALLIEKKWMAPELVTLFSNAQRICEDRSNDA